MNPKEVVKEWEQTHGTVRIKLLPPKKNQAGGFYIMINTSDTFSCVKHEYIIKRSILKLLDKAKIKYKEI